MVKLPVEIQLEIASHFSNMWHRENYLEALGTDEIYYRNKSRPTSRNFQPFQLLPTSLIDKFNQNVITLILPIKKNKRNKYGKSYIFENTYRGFEHSGIETHLIRYIDLFRGNRNENLFYKNEWIALPNSRPR